jgi:3-polyprenyl-4-hydroxybenzoate decarboxylase
MVFLIILRYRRICFLWPASAPQGPTNAKVTIGFCYGNLLSNEQHVLLKEGRKQVYVMRFSSLSEIDEQILNQIIQEAILVDDQFKKTR